VASFLITNESIECLPIFDTQGNQARIFNAAVLALSTWLDRDSGWTLRARFVCFHLWWTTRFVRCTFMMKL